MFTSRDIDTLTSASKTNSFVIIKDHVFDDIIDQLRVEVGMLKSMLRPAKMSRGAQVWEDEYFRGDMMCWVTPDLCSEMNLIALKEFVARLLKENELLRESLSLTGGYNFQFALYPGKGEGYNRHKDAFPVPANSLRTDINIASTRQLTLLLYLNKEWEPEDGGQLRIFTPAGAVIEGVGEPFDFWGVRGYDIDPVFGRLVVFRSGIVEHAVLPCFRERMALTFWAQGYGPTLPEELNGERATIFEYPT